MLSTGLQTEADSQQKQLLWLASSFTSTKRQIRVKSFQNNVQQTVVGLLVFCVGRTHVLGSWVEIVHPKETPLSDSQRCKNGNVCGQ